MIRILLVVFAIALVASNAVTWLKTSGYYRDKAATVAAQVRAEHELAIAAEVSKRAAIDIKLAAAEKAASQVREVEVIKWKTIKQEVDRVIEKPVYRECRLDDDGVRIFNAAAAGVSVRLAPASEQPAAVPEQPAAPAAKRDDGRPAGGGGGGLRVLPRLPS